MRVELTILELQSRALATWLRCHLQRLLELHKSYLRSLMQLLFFISECNILQNQSEIRTHNLFTALFQLSYLIFAFRVTPSLSNFCTHSSNTMAQPICISKSSTLLQTSTVLLPARAGRDDRTRTYDTRPLKHKKLQLISKLRNTGYCIAALPTELHPYRKFFI